MTLDQKPKKKRTVYLPAIAWVSRSKHIHELVKVVDEGLDYCPKCAQTACNEYHKNHPQWKDYICVSGGNDVFCEAESTPICSRCNCPLACSIINGPVIRTLAQWLRQSNREAA